MIIGKRCLALCAGSVAVLSSMTAGATSLVQLRFEDLVDQSAVVVVGEAVGSRVEQTDSGVVTVTTFNVEDAVVGDPGSTIEVATPGGIYQPGKFLVREIVPGVPTFVNGKESLLFLSSDSNIVGFNQGALAVTETASGKSVRLPGSDRSESLESAKSRIRAAKHRD